MFAGWAGAPGSRHSNYLSELRYAVGGRDSETWNGPRLELSGAVSPYPNVEGLRPPLHLRKRIDGVDCRSSRRDLPVTSRYSMNTENGGNLALTYGNS